MTSATQFTAPIAELGEGPIWDPRHAKLIMVDLLRGDILTIDDNGTETRKHVSKIVSVLRPRVGGGLAVGIEQGFQFLGDDLEPTDDPIIAFDQPGIRMNDGGCDPQGRFYAGSMAYDETAGAGSIYRLDPDGSVTAVWGGVTVSNGIQWSADGERVFYNDTPTRQVTVFDFDATAGTVHDPRPFATIEDGNGFPDGMAIDAEDGIWVPLWQGGAVHRYDQSGTLTEVIELPASKVTACAFGGPDLRTLYITTANLDIPAGQEPGAGAVFAVDTGVTGSTPCAFAG